MKYLSGLVLLCALLPGSTFLLGQELGPFPEGQEGLNYDAVRIDLLGDCSISVEVDGVLDDKAWELAPFHPFMEYWKGGLTPCFAPDADPATCIDEDNFWPTIAAVADEDFLYVAWRIIDDTRSVDNDDRCSAFKDDGIEVYIDYHNDKAGAYEEDDVQYEIWAGTIVGPDDDPVAPEDFPIGWITGGGCQDAVNVSDTTGEPLVLGGATDILDENEIPIGWQGEVAFALRNEGTNGKTWEVIPDEGVSIGIDFHSTDDDIGGSQGGGDDSAHIWSLNDPNSQAWKSPSVFGTLTFRVLPSDACGGGPVEGDRQVAGDCDQSGDRGIGDLTCYVGMLFPGFNLLSRTASSPCSTDEGNVAVLDVNGDASVGISDIVYLSNSLFQGGPDPVQGTGCFAVGAEGCGAGASCQ